MIRSGNRQAKRLSSGAAMLTLVLVLFSAEPAAAGALIQLSPAEPGVYAVQGFSLQQVAAIELTITYDSGGLANPRIDQGPLLTGAMSAINANVSGVIRAAFMRVAPISGNGLLARVSFDRIETAPGRALSLSAKLTSLDGTSLPVSTQIVNLPEQGAETKTTSSSPNASKLENQQTAQVVAPTGITTGLIIPGPGEQPATRQTGTSDLRHSEASLVKTGQTLTASENETLALSTSPAAKSASDLVAPSKKTITLSSVLERFTAFKGKKTPAKMLALLDEDLMPGIRQDPPVALSDGKQKITLHFLTEPDRKNGDVAIMGASILSLKPEPDRTNSWIAIILPEAGCMQASISVTQSSSLLIVPLTIAPKVNVDLDGSGSVTEEDFNLFLAEKGTAKKPRFDLNKDGKRDAVDDYIFTVNYLASRTGTDRKK